MTGSVHEATVLLDAGADQRAPGAAVTVRLCGHWEHDGACRWPHHTAIDLHDGDQVTVRTVFVSKPEDADFVRDEIRTALRSGTLDGPDGVSSWSLVADAAAQLRPDEAALAQRLAGTGLAE